MRIDRLHDARLLSRLGASDMNSTRIDGNRVLLDVYLPAGGDMILTGRMTCARLRPPMPLYL
jgi:hypothetical protein